MVSIVARRAAIELARKQDLGILPSCCLAVSQYTPPPPPKQSYPHPYTAGEPGSTRCTSRKASRKTSGALARREMPARRFV
jgi:hypothetical protein